MKFSKHFKNAFKQDVEKIILKLRNRKPNSTDESDSSEDDFKILVIEKYGNELLKKMKTELIYTSYHNPNLPIWIEMQQYFLLILEKIKREKMMSIENSKLELDKAYNDMWGVVFMEWEQKARTIEKEIKKIEKERERERENKQKEIEYEFPDLEEPEYEYDDF